MQCTGEQFIVTHVVALRLLAAAGSEGKLSSSLLLLTCWDACNVWLLLLLCLLYRLNNVTQIEGTFSHKTLKLPRLRILVPWVAL